MLQIIADVVNTPLEKITLQSKIEELTSDSIQLFELILAFEREFKAEADYTDLMAIETVADIITYLENRYPQAVRQSDHTRLSGH